MDIMEKEKREVYIGRNLLDPRHPVICVPVVGDNRSIFLENAQKALDAGPDVIELRVDTLDGRPDADRMAKELEPILQTRGTAQLLTFRTQRDGGNGDPDSLFYQEFLLEAMEVFHPDAVDMEISAGDVVFGILRDSARVLGIPTLASWHSFKETPSEDELVSIFLHMDALGADVAKIAVMPNCIEDVETLRRAAKRADACGTPLIAISMGEMGKRSRIECTDFASCLTFASAGTGSAPGQMSVQEIRKVFGRAQK